MIKLLIFKHIKQIMQSQRKHNLQLQFWILLLLILNLIDFERCKERISFTIMFF